MECNFFTFERMGKLDLCNALRPQLDFRICNRSPYGMNSKISQGIPSGPKRQKIDDFSQFSMVEIELLFNLSV